MSDDPLRHEIDVLKYELRDAGERVERLEALLREASLFVPSYTFGGQDLLRCIADVLEAKP